MNQKDFLSVGNKHYSPETVVFVSSTVNKFIIGNGNNRGDYMIGVSFVPNLKKNSYKAECSSPFGGRGYIGVFPTEDLAWAKKHQYACMLADLQEDERISSAYARCMLPIKDWTKV